MKKYYIYKGYINNDQFDIYFGERGWNHLYRFIEVDVDAQTVNFYKYDYSKELSLLNIDLKRVDLDGALEIPDPLHDFIYDNSNIYI